MYILHRIGPRISSNWNTLEEILASEGPISFDGVYSEVYEHYRELKGKDVTFFVSGKYVGGNNDFDLHSGEKPGTFCTWAQVLEMAGYLGAEVAYHGWEHRKCVGLARDELINELAPRPAFCQSFAWPHGVCDDLAILAAKTCNYTRAWCAGPHGDDSEFQRKRRYLNW